MKKALLALLILVMSGLSMAELPSWIRVGEPVEVPLGVTVDCVVAIGGAVVVNGVVENDVVAIGGPVTLGDQSVIGGDLVTIGGKVMQQPGAKVLKKQHAVPKREHHAFFFPWVSLGWGILALVILALFPAYVGRISSEIESSPVRLFLSGVVALLLIVPVAILLVITLVGIVLIPLEIAGIGVMVVLGSTAVAQLIGKRLILTFRAQSLPIVVETLLGLVAIAGIGLVPVLGALIKGIIACVGLGAIARSWFRWIRKTPQ